MTKSTIRTTWKKIDDSKVQHTWKCPECGEMETVSPDWYSDNGTPMCGDCGVDMEYQYTEIAS